MKMLLRAEFPNGHFGDPALYLRDIGGKTAFLFDCGDLTRFSTKKLLKVTHIFLSHCHIDHFFGFDQFLRVHMGAVKSTHVMGPRETADRVAGKLGAYTWNLIREQELEFVVTELDPSGARMRTVRFRSDDRFLPGDAILTAWSPERPVLDLASYKVFAAELDHRTLSPTRPNISPESSSASSPRRRGSGKSSRFISPSDTWIARSSSWERFPNISAERSFIYRRSRDRPCRETGDPWTDEYGPATARL